MKRFLICTVLALCLLLTSCGLVEREYESVTPHVDQRAVEEDEDALTAQNYLSLRNAILSFVQNGVEHGVIRINDYVGEVEEDLAAAAYEVSKNDPLGAYAVDYMTHDCALIVSYYEVHIDITFRRTLEQIQAVQRASDMTAFAELMGQTMTSFGSELTARVSYYNGEDVEALAHACYAADPASIMEMPQVTVNVYPESGYVRIVEVLFSYTEDAETLRDMRDAVATSVRAAQEYVRYRSTDAEKLQLLYTYLQKRFTYGDGATATPVYSFLCEGMTTNEGCAKSLQLICDQMGLECDTVEGNRSGEPYFWNIVSVDGTCRHVDLLQSLQDGADSLALYPDSAMTEYFWPEDDYPVCPDESA